MRCKICSSSKLKPVSDQPFSTGKDYIQTILLKCESCGSYVRNIDYSAEKFLSHFNQTSYTDEKYEKQYFENRIGFFNFIFELLQSHMQITPGKMNLLDMGCSYGHMMQDFQKRGLNTAGVEIADIPREKLNKMGYRVYRQIDEIPHNSRFDIITFIDCLCYFNDPVDVLAKARSLQSDNCLLVIREANRTPFLNLASALRLKISVELFRDVKHNYSYKALQIMTRAAGYEIIRLVIREKGKKQVLDLKGKNQVWYKRLYGKIIPWVIRLSGNRIGIKLSPGILIICKPLAS